MGRRICNWDAEELNPMPIPRKGMIQFNLHRPMVRGALAVCHGRLWGYAVAICTHGKQITTTVAVTRVSDHAASKASRPNHLRMLATVDAIG
jgi:hypothetical protein